MKNLKSIVASTVLTAALAVPMAAWSANFCASPSDTASVTFGTGTAGHQLFPDEVTISKGGTVTFSVPGGGHYMSFYPVSKNTTREDIEKDLLDPLDATKNCVEFAGTETTCTANSRYLITDGSSKLVFDTGINDPANANDFNRVNFASGATTALAAGTVITNKFFKTGRYMIVCDNRGHGLTSPFMFGFVNVVNCDDVND